MTFSPEQNAIFTFFKSGKGNLTVEAKAGTGKTTTIKEAFRHAPEGKILYAVFNKKNQREAAEKIADGRVQIKTLHSLGFMFIKKVWNNAKPDDSVEYDRLNSFINCDMQREFAGQVLKLVSFAKNLTINTTREQLSEICEDRDLPQDAIELAMKVLEQSKKQDVESRISFDDMVWLPCAMGIVRPCFDLVCIDEAQDMNLPQLTMARQACRQGGRVVVVGDSRQAIYGFRGAVQNGMEMMTVTLRAVRLSLSTTYRCPRLVVEQAQKIVPDYKAAPEAPEGEILYSQNVFQDAQINDAILSRLNAPLMPLALQFLRANRPCRIEGRDIGKQLLAYVRSFKAVSVPNFLEKIATWESKQVERLTRAAGNRPEKAEKKIEQTRDIAETLRALAQDAKSISDIDTRINNLFGDTNENSKPVILLSSVHKAKGLEWNRVILLTETFRNGKGNSEEDNIWYVAVTRAKQTLIFGNADKLDGMSNATEKGYKGKEAHAENQTVPDNRLVEKSEAPVAGSNPAVSIKRPMPQRSSIPQSELDQIARNADVALKRANLIAHDNDFYMTHGHRYEKPISIARE